MADPAMARYEVGIAVTINRQRLDAGVGPRLQALAEGERVQNGASPVNSSNKATSWPARSCAEPERRRGSLASPGARTVTISLETAAFGAGKRCACADVRRADFKLIAVNIAVKNPLSLSIRPHYR